jgi:hypothetical protein
VNSSTLTSSSNKASLVTRCFEPSEILNLRPKY